MHHGSLLRQRRTIADLAIASTRCATFDGQRHCLGLGWTTKTEEAAAGYRANQAHFQHNLGV